MITRRAQELELSLPWTLVETHQQSSRNSVHLFYTSELRKQVCSALLNEEAYLVNFGAGWSL